MVYIGGNMLTYMCKNCGQFTILGYINEFGEHFCDKECYEKYCEKHRYISHLDELKELDFSK